VKHLDDKHRLSYDITARIEPLAVALKDRQPFWESRRDDGAQKLVPLRIGYRSAGGNVAAEE